MSKSRTVENDSPTPDQLAEFHAQIQSGQITGTSLRYFLMSGTIRSFTIPATIDIGKPNLCNADDYIKAVREKGMRISDSARALLINSQFAVSPVPQKLSLVDVSVAELGFGGGAKLEAVYQRAQQKGLSLLPNESGPALRLQYRKQSVGEVLIIGMRPIRSGKWQTDHLFSLKKDMLSGGCLILGRSHRKRTACWPATSRFIFSLPQ